MRTKPSMVAFGLLAAALTALPFARAQTTMSIAGGSGPDAPALTTTAALGTWAPPQPTNNLPAASLTGMSRILHINNANDFCVLLPPDPTQQNLVDAEANAVAYCYNPTNGTRPMPDGFILSAHYVQTADYVQVTGTFNAAVMNLASNDCGGEYDNHGAQGVGNPVGVGFPDGFHDFFQFLGSCDIPGSSTFGIRMCRGSNSYNYCKNTYDLMGLLFVMPGFNGAAGFDQCDATDPLFVGSYGTSTFTQGMSSTPDASHYPPAPPSSGCKSVAAPTSSGVTYTWNQAGNARATGGASYSPSTGAATAPTAAGTSSAAGSSNNANGNAAASASARPNAAAAAVVASGHGGMAVAVTAALAFGLTVVAFAA